MIVLVLVDFHIHSDFSADGQSRIENYCRKAAVLGISEIGFAEHIDFNPVDFGYGRYDYEGNLAEVLRLKKIFGNVPKIRFGAEITYEKKFEGDIRSYMKGKSFEYFVGSVHIIGDKAISRIDGENYFEGKTEEEAYLPYFVELKSAAKSGLFNIIGHFDLIKRYGVSYFGKFNPEKYGSEIKEILGIMIDKNIALEINGSGMRQLPKETYPSLETVKLYKELGGNLITVGSDCHSTESLGAGIGEAIVIAKEAGFNEVITFEKGNISFIKI